MVNVARIHLLNLHDLLIHNADPYSRRKHLRVQRLKIKEKAKHELESYDVNMFDYYHILFKEYLISLLDTLRFLRDNGVDLNEIVDIDINDDEGMTEYLYQLLEELNRIRDENLGDDE